MAIDWTKLFGDLGAIIARSNSYASLAATTLGTDLDTLLTQFDLTRPPNEGISTAYDAYRATVVGWRESLASYADARLLDRDTVLEELGLESADLAAVLQALQRQMRTERKLVKACTVTVGGAVTPSWPAPVNRGNGSVWTTTLLDGWSRPGRDMPACVWYEGVRSELACTETMTLECVADSADGLTEGSEVFSWSGNPRYGDFDWRGEGSGAGPTLAVADSESLASGRSLGSFSGNVPLGWSLTYGTSGTHCLTDLDDPWRGDASTKLVGNNAVVELSQSLSPTAFQGRRRYHLGLALQCSGAVNSDTRLVVGFRGTGYAAGSEEAIVIPGASFSGLGAWTEKVAWPVAPAPVPSDWRLVIRLENAPSTTVVRLSSLSLAPVVWHGGIGLAIRAGREPWLRGDRLTFSVTNNGAGLFQTFARRRWKMQLPSIVAATHPLGLLLGLNLLSQATTATISDSLVA